MMHRCLWLLLLCASCHLFAQTIPPTRILPARRTTTPIKIDGLLNDAAWKDAPAALGYTEFRPTPFRTEDPALKTEVYMLYSDEGLYLGGYCHERSKDSISTEVNGRDGFGNNDYVGFIFDTYYDKINAFEYFVTPRGEQMDAKMAPNPNGNSEDFSWNAVWKSAATIHNDGWSFEIFIPFSAIRFSSKNIQDWGFNITRRRQKTGQQNTWNPIDVNVNGFLTQEGIWQGLENIKPPLRLQFFPYVSYYVNHYPFNQKGVSDYASSLNGGMDVKYGINQALTLDMTLIPDFGQVQSDNHILNLTPFEVKYNENRPFFTEGTELFNKGGYFYSRRVGGTPLHFYDVQDTGTSAYTLHANEHFISNPTETKLINATKISGRLQSGLGIGFFNAIAAAQYATAEDDAGHQRKIETSPLTNYNILVLDQSLKYNSSISFINNSVIRNGRDYDADVAAVLINLYDKKNIWNIGGKFALSNLFHYTPTGGTLTGYSQQLTAGKVSGPFTFSYNQDLTNDKFNNNDLGYVTNNNYLNQNLTFQYNWTKPTSWYNNFAIGFQPQYRQHYNPWMYEHAELDWFTTMQLKNLWYVNAFFGREFKNNDFYESRTDGRLFKRWSDWYSDVAIQTNVSKAYSVEAELMYVARSLFSSKRYRFNYIQTYRFSKQFSLTHVLDLQPQRDNVGYATQLDNDIIFGRRDVRTVENDLRIKYSFNPKLVFNATVRHYWSQLNYKELFNLQQDGTLQQNTTFKGDLDPDYNEFTVNAGLNWEFAPGSFFTLVWKNITDYSATTPYGVQLREDYFQNFSHTIQAPQNNNFSVRIIYFLDYLQLAKHKHVVKP